MTSSTSSTAHRSRGEATIAHLEVRSEPPLAMGARRSAADRAAGSAAADTARPSRRASRRASTSAWSNPRSRRRAACGRRPRDGHRDASCGCTRPAMPSASQASALRALRYLRRATNSRRSLIGEQRRDRHARPAGTGIGGERRMSATHAGHGAGPVAATARAGRRISTSSTVRRGCDSHSPPVRTTSCADGRRTVYEHIPGVRRPTPVSSSTVRQLLALPPWDELRRRLPRLLTGLVLCGLAFALPIRAGLGVDPWDVLHLGIAGRTGIPVGTVSVLVGLVVLIGWFPLAGTGRHRDHRQRDHHRRRDRPRAPAPACGRRRRHPLGDAALRRRPRRARHRPLHRRPARSRPRDGIMTGIAKRGHSVRVVRTGIELDRAAGRLAARRARSASARCCSPSRSDRTSTSGWTGSTWANTQRPRGTARRSRSPTEQSRGDGSRPLSNFEAQYR